MGAAGAALLAFEGTSRGGRGSLVNSAASPVGLSVGALGSASLVRFLPEPTKAVYFLVAALLLGLGASLLWLPSAGRKAPGAVRSLVPEARIPRSARRTMAATMPVAAATWALAGFYLSLGPVLAHAMTRTARSWWAGWRFSRSSCPAPWPSSWSGAGRTGTRCSPASLP